MLKRNRRNFIPRLRKKAVQGFLARKLKDFRPLKKLSKERLDGLMETLPVKPPCWSKMRNPQRVCVLLGAKLRRYAFFADTGVGKSLISISLAGYFEELAAKKILVLVTNKTNKFVWEKEIKKHLPSMPYEVLEGLSEYKLTRLFETDALLVIETYAGFTRMCCDVFENELVLNKPLLNKLAKLLDGVVCDESTALMNRESLIYRIVRYITKNPNKLVFLLSGTPFGRNPIALWSQLYLVDNGGTLGKSIGLFRAAFFKAKLNDWGVPEFTFDKKKEQLLNKMLANRSIRYDADAADLPEVVRITREVFGEGDMSVYLERAKATLIKACADHNMQAVQNSFIRMRQISSGWLGFKDDETGDRASVVFKDKPKLYDMLSLISVIDEYKIIVFYEFNASVPIIEKGLRDIDKKFIHIGGKTKDVEAVYTSFLDKDGPQILLLQNSMVFGLNTQIAKYGMMYESPVPCILRKQAERRIERQYSEHETVFIYDFVTNGGVDQTILDYHAEGADLFSAIIEGKSIF